MSADAACRGRLAIVMARLKFPMRLARAAKQRRHLLLVGYGARPDKPDLITGA
jgi:hypothetical protein